MDAFIDALTIIVDFYFIFIFVLIVLGIILRNRRVFNYAMFFILMLICYSIASFFGLKASIVLYEYIVQYTPIVLVVILSPEIRKLLDGSMKYEKAEDSTSSTNKTKKDIVDAIQHLSDKRIGALITIEKYNSLDQYAERAIQMDSNVSKELLINIFSPLTPLHDGAVIIRGNKIRCAGAYYVLTETENFDKTMGSRHRAALGISEITDSLTIVVSEETGNISITTEGIMLKVNDENKLLEYIEMFLK